ncbi:tetratricopeptide repeat protein [Thiofilum flexile]|uniref:tetratricopeptide repeat protein n=1 Tax=Thiofilum flexile TaxID=125627 RepID=UPI0003750FCD|nr:tetratricopeptide repeat protein [Thiofilum flexile]
MSPTSLSRRLYHTMLALALVGGALTTPTVFALDPVKDSAQETPEAPIQLNFSSERSRNMFHLIVGELYRQQDQIEQALEHYAIVAGNTKDINISKEAAQIAIEAGDNKLAERFVTQWAEAKPTSMDVYQARAIVRARAGEYDKALEDVVWLRDAANKKSGHGFEYILSTLTLEAGPEAAYEVFKRYSQTIDKSPAVKVAVAHLAQTLERDTDTIALVDEIDRVGSAAEKEQAAYIRSKIYLRQGKPEEALKILEPFIKTTKEYELKLDYARTLVMLERRVEAMPIFKELYESQPDDDNTYYTLGLLYLEQKEYTFAEPLIKKLLEIPSRRHDANYFLGQIFEGLNRPDDAFKVYEQALPNSRFANEAMVRAAALLNTKSGLDSALKWLAEQASKLNLNEAQQADVRRVEAQLLQDAERYPEAAEILTKADKLRPNNPDTLYQRSLVYEKMGKITEAEQDLKAILSNNPDNAPALNALGYLLTVNTQRYKEAQEMIQKAAKLNPEDPAIMDSLGWVAFKLNELESAETELRKAFKLLPDAEVGSHLAQVLHARGKTEEAKKLLADLMNKYPNNKLLAEANKRVVGLK